MCIRDSYFLTEFSGDWASEAHVKEQPLDALMAQGKKEEAEEVKKQVAASGTRIEELSTKDTSGKKTIFAVHKDNPCRAIRESCKKNTGVN